MTIIRRLQSRLYQRLNLPFPWVSNALLGRELVVRDGTIPNRIDYDDAWFHACARHAKLVLDVGANVGHSALMALLCPNVEQIVLVEANWEALAVASQNLIRNQLSSRARFVNAFASDAGDQAIDFWTVGIGAAGSMYQSHAVTAARAKSVRRVPTVTIDELCTSFGLAFDFVKIDVEGAESKVLDGSRQLASRQATRFIVEMHSMPELTMEDNANRVLAWARSVGYAAWYLSAATRLESSDTMKHRGRCHFLLQPEAWPYPEWLVGIAQSAALPTA